jgi:hypothetical protein
VLHRKDQPEETATHGSNEAPLGHSIAAHRVFGWCSHCKEHGVAEEVGAWRIREHRLLEEQDQAARSHGTNATADGPVLCPECGERLLTVITVRVLTSAGPRVAGGWAYCTGCDATPHPVMEESRG